MIFKKKRKQPKDESYEFVGNYIDLIHELDWPEEYGEEPYINFFKKLPDKQRKIWATWIYQGEVENGGHSQYFRNLQDHSYLVECMAGLQEIGAKKIVAILQKALKLTEDYVDELNNTNDWSEWTSVLDKYGVKKKLWRLDEKFYDEVADFYDSRKSYIEKHIKDFENLKSN